MPTRSTAAGAGRRRAPPPSAARPAPHRRATDGRVVVAASPPTTTFGDRPARRAAAARRAGRRSSRPPSPPPADAAIQRRHQGRRWRAATASLTGVGTRARRGEHVVALGLDAVEDAAVEVVGGGDAARRAAGQHGDARARRRGTARGSGRSRSASARRTPACSAARRGRRRSGRGPPGARTGGRRSRSSSMSRRKFVSWNASPRARAGGVAAAEVGRLEDRQHHLADHRRRAVHVAAQVVVRRRSDSTVRSIAIDRRKRRKASGSMSNARTVWTTAFSTRSSDAPALEVGEEAVAERRAAPRPARRAGAGPRSSTMSSA